MLGRFFLILLFVLAYSFGYSTEPEVSGKPPRKGACAGYSTRDATALSMMGWGLGLGVGIATLCALIPNNSSSSNSHSH